MSKELLEIKKKIAEAQKKKQKELEEKSKEKISDLINSAINKKTKLEEKIKIRAQDEKNKLFILLSTKIALTLILFIILIYLIVYVNSNPVYELSKLKEIKLEDEEIKDIKSICENIYTAFQSKDYINIKKLSHRIDDEWQNECIELISNLNKFPDFEKIKILSPPKKESLFYAFIPISKKLKLQFVLKKENNLFSFEGLYLN